MNLVSTNPSVVPLGGTKEDDGRNTMAGCEFNRQLEIEKYVENKEVYGERFARQYLKTNMAHYRAKENGKTVPAWDARLTQGGLATEDGKDLLDLTEQPLVSHLNEHVSSEIKARVPIEMETVRQGNKLAISGADIIFMPEHITESGKLKVRFVTVYRKDALDSTIYHGSQIDLGSNMSVEEAKIKMKLLSDTRHGSKIIQSELYKDAFVFGIEKADRQNGGLQARHLSNYSEIDYVMPNSQMPLDKNPVTLDLIRQKEPIGVLVQEIEAIGKKVVSDTATTAIMTGRYIRERLSEKRKKTISTSEENQKNKKISKKERKLKKYSRISETKLNSKFNEKQKRLRVVKSKGVLFARKIHIEQTRQLIPSISIGTDQTGKSFEKKKLFRRKTSPSYLENVVKSNEMQRKRGMKKRRFLMGERIDRQIDFRKIVIEKNKHRKELKTRAARNTEVQAQVTKPEMKHKRIFRDVFARLARQINRKKESQILRNSGRAPAYRMGKEVRHTKEKKRMIVLQFSFALLLYKFSHVEKNLKRPSRIVIPHKFDTFNVNRVKRQEGDLKKQGKTDIEDRSIEEQEATPWVLLSIIWYLTMIREGGWRKSKVKNQKSKVTIKSMKKSTTGGIIWPFNGQAMPQQAVIFAYHS